MLKLSEFHVYGFDLVDCAPALNVETVGPYIQEHGRERAAGYISAIEEFNKRIDPILYQRLPDDGYYLNTPAAVRRELEKYYHEQINFHSSQIVDYIRSGDKDWPKGYVDATGDLIKGMSLVLKTPLENGGYQPNTGILGTHKLKELVQDKTDFSNVMRQMITAVSNSASPNNKTNLQP